MKLTEIQQKLKAPKGQYNKFSGFYYRNCEDILEAVKPLLGESKLVLSDEPVAILNRVYIKATATFTDESGIITEVFGYAREPETKKGFDEAQLTGGSSSYARKFALNGLFLIDDNKDADSQDNTKPVDLDRSSFGKLDYSQMLAGLEECQDLEQLKTVFQKVIKGVGNDAEGQRILTAKKDELKVLLSRSPV